VTGVMMLKIQLWSQE